jgi:hypothetical protein
MHMTFAEKGLIRSEEFNDFARRLCRARAGGGRAKGLESGSFRAFFNQD